MAECVTDYYDYCTIPHCLSFAIFCHYPLSVIHYTSLSVISHCLSLPIDCHYPLFYIPIVCYSLLFAVPHCLPFHIVIHCLAFPICFHSQFSVPQIEYPPGGSSKTDRHVYFLLQVFWEILLFCQIVLLFDRNVVLRSQYEVTIVVPWQLSQEVNMTTHFASAP